jgi:hypothetical protein
MGRTCSDYPALRERKYITSLGVIANERILRVKQSPVPRHYQFNRLFSPLGDCFGQRAPSQRHRLIEVKELALHPARTASPLGECNCSRTLETKKPLRLLHQDEINAIMNMIRKLHLKTAVCESNLYWTCHFDPFDRLRINSGRNLCSGV